MPNPTTLSIVAEALNSENSAIRIAAQSLSEALGPIAAQPFDEVRGDLELTCALDRMIHQEIATVFDISLRENLLGAARQNAEWLREVFLENPDDRQRISDFIQAHASTSFPWDIVQPETTGLAFLYNFSPFQDTGATVASKRIRNFGKTVDVIACSFLHRKKQDTTVEAIAQPYVASRHFLPLAASWASWDPFKAFAVRANKYADSKIANGSVYEFVYTRAMWAPSHYAGAIFKKNHPEVKWIAEFSDPLSLDVEGLPRGGAIPMDEISEPLVQQLLEVYPDIPPENISIFSLAELLPYAFADEIIFTNSNQKLTMLDHITSSSLRERVENIGTVSNHPTLPREYYEREKSDYKINPEFLNLGYFGEFYSSRSITEVTSAMRTLPPELAERVHLHVFTNYIPATEGNRRPRNFSKRQYDDLVKRAHDGVGAHGIEDRVHFNASLPYLKFLATTEKLDYLIVNDARSGELHDVNPYLPSKWSDYAGSTAKSWGFIEDGSILSGKPVAVKTPIGDALEARRQLWEMIVEKFPHLREADGGSKL